MPIVLGKSVAAIIYAVLTLAVFVVIVVGVVTANMPSLTLIALLTLPVAIMAIIGALRYRHPDKLATAMKNNVIVVLATQALLSIGYFLA